MMRSFSYSRVLFVAVVLVLASGSVAGRPPKLADGTNIWLQTCDANSAFQQWQHQADGSIRLVADQKCVDVSNFGTKDGSNVWLYSCHLSSHGRNQMWTVQGDQFVNKLSGECLAGQQGVPALDGANVAIWNCSTAAGRASWTFNANAAGTIQWKANSSLCLSVGPTPSCQTPGFAHYPWCNASDFTSARVSALVSKMTPYEKVVNLQNNNPGVARLGVPPLVYHEALHGVVVGCGQAAPGSTGCPTSFPSALSLGATFNRTLWTRIGQAISTEARALDNEHIAGLAYWAPDINLFRDPRWGRGQEVPGECPLLSSEYVYHYTSNMQQGDSDYLKVISTCKHFSAYGIEDWHHNSRFSFNALVDAQDLAESYWPAFKSCVQRAKAASIMCSYNSVNGIPSCANSYFNNQIVRKQWGFDGFIVSDCGAITNIMKYHNYTKTYDATVKAGLEGGTDVNCGGFYADHMMDALQNKAIDEADIDTAATRVYTQFMRAGLFDPPGQQPYKQIPYTVVDSPAHRQLALEAALQAITLLKNDKNTLPLDGTLETALVGPHANATQDMLSNYHGTNTLVNSHSPLQVIGAKVKVHYAPGCKDIQCNDTSGFDAAVQAAKSAKQSVVFVGLDQGQEREGHDRVSLELPGNQLDLVKAIVATGTPTVVVLMNGGPLAVEWVKDNVPAIVECFYPGELGGDALYALLFKQGGANFGGRLPYTVYPKEFIERPMTNFNMRTEGGVTYRFYTGTPLWSFGDGLSYTTFSYEFAGQPPQTHSVDDIHNGLANPTYYVNVTNTGALTGDAVVLGYVSPQYKGAPIKQLFDFDRVTLRPGQSATVLLAAPASPLAAYDTTRNVHRVAPGMKYVVRIGENSNYVETVLTLTGSMEHIEMHIDPEQMKSEEMKHQQMMHAMHQQHRNKVPADLK